MADFDKDRGKRRPRDPQATRSAILDAARHLLSKDGPDGVSLSEVAHLAGVNRGTAYQHFATREALIDAAMEAVSDEMFRSVFGDPETIGERRVEQVDPADLIDRVASFGMDNPELCRIWLMQVLASPDPSRDAFWREYQGSLGRFAETKLAQPHIDTEVMSVINLAGAFLWPVWAKSHARSDADRKQLAHRFASEMLRLSMYGSLREHEFPEVAARLEAENAPGQAMRKAI